MSSGPRTLARYFLPNLIFNNYFYLFVSSYKQISIYLHTSYKLVAISHYCSNPKCIN